MFIFSCLVTALTATLAIGWQPFQKELTTIRDCDDILKHINKRKVRFPSPPYLNGDWVSQRCEIRSGPEFLLRKYSFDNVTTVFEARQYYYTDSDCHHPSHLIVARGSFHPPRPQFLMPEASEMDYRLSHVTVMPYTHEAARHVSKLVNQSCPGTVTFPWRLKTPYEIFKFHEFEDRIDGNMFLDVDCTAALNFSLHELQLFRMEVIRHHHEELKELYLGDVHTAPVNRKTHRSTSFQAPLVEMKNHGCGSVCRALSKSSDVEAPKLHKAHTVSTRRLFGEWVSMGCESRPNGQFVTRKVKFEPSNATWSGMYLYASDPGCQGTSFALRATGYYYHESNANIMRNAENYRFRVDKLTVTSMDDAMTDNLNERAGCGVKQWKTGVEQDVTVTKGCITLGIKIPYIEYELVRLEKTKLGYLLALGERPSDGSTPNSPVKRPTAFQAPLIRCNYNEREIIEPVEKESKYWERFVAGESNRARISLSLLAIVVLFAMF